MSASKLPDLNSLSLEQQVAQMVVGRASGYLLNHQIQYPAWEPKAAQLHCLQLETKIPHQRSNTPSKWEPSPQQKLWLLL